MRISINSIVERSVSTPMYNSMQCYHLGVGGQTSKDCTQLGYKSFFGRSRSFGSLKMKF